MKTIAALLCLLAFPASAFWIEDNPKTAHCCGKADCRPLAETEVWQGGGKWFVKVRGSLVYPANLYATREPRFRFWGCFDPAGGVRCLFIPMAF
jgi:hypothetical protein